MFNRENIAQAQADFAENRYCVIDNVLEDRYIRALYRAVPKLEYGAWGCIRNSHNRYPHSFLQSEKLQDTIWTHVEEGRGEFSYWHYAYWLEQDKHKRHDSAEVTYFNRVVTEDYSIGKPDYTFHDLVSEVTQFPNMMTKQPTYSYYDYQSWLKAHNDPRRWCAYILYFNKTWEPHWGGQLCIMDESEQNIKESIIPRGNRLVIMDVSELLRQRMNYHFISPVSITADHPRYSLAGWFYQKDTDGPSPVVSQ